MIGVSPGLSSLRKVISAFTPSLSAAISAWIFFPARTSITSRRWTYATELFGIARHEINLLDRGLEFPREIRSVEHLMRQEREQMRGLGMEEADSPHPSFLKRLRQMFSRRIITQPEDLEREIQHIIDEGEERGLITRQEGSSSRVSLSSGIPSSGRSWSPAWRWWGWSGTLPWTRSSNWSCACGHSRLPVFAGDIDHIKGILLAKDLLVFWPTPGDPGTRTGSSAPPILSPKAKKSATSCGTWWNAKPRSPWSSTNTAAPPASSPWRISWKRSSVRFTTSTTARNPASSPRKTALSWWTPAWTWKN